MFRLFYCIVKEIQRNWL